MPAKPPQRAAKGDARRSAKRAAKPCPICGNGATAASKPFCSERCRDVDLNRWLSGSYVVPGRADEDEDKE